jgi:excinuclease ABC subunit C
MSTEATEQFDGRRYARKLPHAPGVYRMLDEAGRALYVGKARDLNKRVASYFASRPHGVRIATMLSHVSGMEVTVTRTEGEALLLENQQIKSLKPRYNILLRDDKSYPYIHVSTDETYPRMAFHRGPRREAGHYFGPYPSASAVRDSLSLLQKAFRIRQCDNSFFANRSRPCLQYQIGRCTAPCVGFIDENEYRRDVEDCIRFLKGESDTVIEDLVERMNAASEEQAFERAAQYRDRIATLRRIQERSHVSGAAGDVDVMACAAKGGVACVQVFFLRGGRSLGNRAFFPRLPGETEPAGVLSAFLPQFYMERSMPSEILATPKVPERKLLEEVFGERAGRSIKIISAPRGERRKWLEMAAQNAERALEAHLASRSGMRERFESLAEGLSLDQAPGRIECFDVSHTRGEATVASCVVFGPEGPLKSDYRRFNIKTVEPGDDYGALREALERRYKRLKTGEGIIPDLLLIDGGKGQLEVARQVLEELQVEGVMLVGVAKGRERRAGDEQLFSPAWRGPRRLRPDSPGSHLLQSVRDEAHRFAITGHRQQRGKSRRRSMLEDIPGIGAKRRRALWQHFGGLQALRRAGVEDVAAVPGISNALADRIVATLRGED